MKELDSEEVEVYILKMNHLAIVTDTRLHALCRQNDYMIGVVMMAVSVQAD